MSRYGAFLVDFGRRLFVDLLSTCCVRIDEPLHDPNPRIVIRRQSELSLPCTGKQTTTTYLYRKHLSGQVFGDLTEFEIELRLLINSHLYKPSEPANHVTLLKPSISICLR